jgi:hypothetical protein
MLPAPAGHEDRDWHDSSRHRWTEDPGLNRGLVESSQRTSQFVKDPDTDIRLRRERGKSEWVSNQTEALRIVSNELFSRTRQRIRRVKDGDVRLKAGGKPPYPLSGLLVCSMCNAHYILGDGYKYACSS